MADSSIDMSISCFNCEAKAKDMILMQEKYEAIYQANHQLKKKVEVMEKFQSECESEVAFFNSQRKDDQSNLKLTQTELESALSKIQKLESLLEEEIQNNQMLKVEIIENKDKLGDNKITKPVPDEEEIDILISKIQKLQAELENAQDLISKLTEEKDQSMNVICQLKCENKMLQDELSEVKEHLQQKTNDIQNMKISIESIREEKLLLTTELQVLKSSDKNAARGNSLFAEVEDNRQKIAAQRELLKMKYLNLKKVVGQKTVENNKLKLEIVKIRREEKDDEKSIHQDYSVLIQTYKERLSELEKEVKTLQQRNAQQSLVMSGDNSNQLQWVSTVVDNARKEASTLQAELDRRGSNFVAQGHELFDSQKENRRLRTLNSKMQSEIDELRLELDRLKSANETVDDGISPPAVDVVVEYQKQKCVKFQEMMEQHNSTSSALPPATCRNGVGDHCNGSDG